MAENKTHILVVDDELSMRELLEYMLNKEGHTVTCAETGREAIRLLGKNNFDLLLCDIRLGDITGLDVLRAAKIQNPDSVVILISAYATTETAVEAMNEGAYDYVPKPFDKDELMHTITTALDLRNLLTVAEAITRSALDRRESRGAHCRLEYPDKDEDHAQHNAVIRRGPDGEMQVVRQDVEPVRDDLQQIIEENR